MARSAQGWPSYLRRALRQWLPDDILDRPKQGFSVPDGQWFRGELREMAHDVLLDPKSLSRGYFRPPEIRAMLDRHGNGADAETKPLWALFMFELWHRQFVDADGPGRRLVEDARRAVSWSS